MQTIAVKKNIAFSLFKLLLVGFATFFVPFLLIAGIVDYMGYAPGRLMESSSTAFPFYSLECAFLHGLFPVGFAATRLGG